MLLMASVAGAEPPRANHAILVHGLGSDDVQRREKLKARVIALEADAVEALVQATCGDPAPDRDLVKATLSILAHWEEKSWTDPDCEAAIDKFVELVRDPANCVRKHLPLSPKARYPFAEAVRVLDVSPDEAAEYLRNRGVKISLLPGGSYSSVDLPRDWFIEPKDCLYIANLARPLPVNSLKNGKRMPISIDISGPLEDDTLVECIKFLRKSKDSMFSLELSFITITREALLLLKSYPHLRSLSLSGRVSPHKWGAAITDEDWALCISAWPDMLSLGLSPSAGRKAIAAAAKMEHIISLEFGSATLTEADLEPLRNHKTLQVLVVMNPKTFEQTFYVDQEDTGKWQLDDECQVK
jgi:hypothetical protein